MAAGSAFLFYSGRLLQCCHASCAPSCYLIPPQVAPGMLITFLQKGLAYVGIEEHLNEVGYWRELPIQMPNTKHRCIKKIPAPVFYYLAHMCPSLHSICTYYVRVHDSAHGPNMSFATLALCAAVDKPKNLLRPVCFFGCINLFHQVGAMSNGTDVFILRCHAVAAAALTQPA